MDHLELHVRVRPHLRAATWLGRRTCLLAQRCPRLRWILRPIAKLMLALMCLFVQRLGGLAITVPNKKP